MATPNPSKEPSFTSLHSTLLSSPPPLLPPGHSLHPSITSQISAALLHPTLESLLHLQNHDLPSAHFLVRHMQARPAWEGMYIHGILHRIEGDMPNCLAWYTDVSSSPAFQSFFGSADGASGGEVNPHLSFLSQTEHDSLASPGPDDTKDEKLPPQRSARVFIRAVEELRKRSTASEGYGERKAALEAVSRAELEALIKYCSDKFGTEKYEDASEAWTRPDEETRKTGERMVSGGEGYRKF
ncbi:hypothetical protein K461DRAFT_275741 [Myriangium duriaei CBS 260.36]|uniref:Uncharacterized protein n=1 Tax=Myriangium duriaei CBS 260.36 TaxID=1168546 RepID=A0A9P4J367_9PEZI|nr:hypothetical protein K461DRAFT_275741 [Myriangium duriaei CBS 260.36]